MDKKKISIINGPNLNMLGIREKNKYGNITFEELISILKKESNLININLDLFQSNSETEIVNYIQSLYKTNIKMIIINASSLTHTSISIRDSLLSVSIPLIEVHITNIFKREPFRRFSYLSDISIGIICGLGIEGYKYALHYANKYI